MTPRYEIYENAEGTVIKMDGNPIQFSMVLSDEQVAKYLLTRAENNARCERTTEAFWTMAD